METLNTVSDVELSKPNILIVDDQPLNIEVVSALLVQDYILLKATSGEEALHITQKENPDLILLDVSMPEMDGYEVCRRLQENAGTRKIPIVFLTARDSDSDEEKGFALGASDYISKPFKPGVTKARVDNLINRKLAENRLNRTVTQLREALDKIKTLRGLLPICSSCKKVRDDQGYWQQIEEHIRENTDAEFSHGICPDCMKDLYPDLCVVDEDGNVRILDDSN